MDINRKTHPAFSKVPEVTAFFWIVKALTTAMGESTSDFLVHTLVPEVAVVLGGIALVAALYVQFGKDRYVPWAYWLAVAMVGVFGTMAADVLHVGLRVPYVVSTVFYGIVLAVVFMPKGLLDLFQGFRRSGFRYFGQNMRRFRL